MIDKVRCIKIGVDCVENDPVDVRCGGPEYLGFDFTVRLDEVDYMKKFIRESLKELGIPLVRMWTYNERMAPVNKAWTKEKIVLQIKNDAEELIRESNYQKRLFR